MTTPTTHYHRAALAIAFALCVPATVHAQSVTGSIYGSAESGTVIRVHNLGSGMTRTVTVDSHGRYRATDLPNGDYTVALLKDGRVLAVRERVQVQIASGTEVSFSQRAVQQLDRINVTASAVPRIDVTQVDTRTVITAEQINRIAVGRNIASVALLAPSVVDNSSYNVPSFGGAASSENAYYINGYAVTNPLTNIGSTSLPFDALAQMQTLTGGYGAEYGRATGGVINIVTKRGSNEWKGGGYSYWSPQALRASPRNRYFPVTGAYGDDNPDPSKRTDGKLDTLRNKNQYWSTTTGAYIGGPVVKDTLFFYGNLEITQREGTSVASSSQAAPSTANAWREYRYDYPRWVAKIDWNISDNHLLELTGVGDTTRYQAAGYTFDYSGFSHGNEQNGGTRDETRSRLYVAKYTGHLTDNLTVSALYGMQKIDHRQSPWGYDPSCPRTSSSAGSRAPGIPAENYAGCWTTSRVNVPGAFDETQGLRLDVGYRLGNHELRIGMDNMDAESYTGSEYGGGFAWIYSRTSNPEGAIDESHGVGSPASAGGLGNDGYYVRKQYYTQVANVRTEQAAQYIEDRWQVTDRLLLQMGLRNESFKNYTSDGKVYVRQDNQWAPRLGAVWDVHGDASLKLFANAGRYHLALPNNVAVRAASNSLYTQEYYTYTGVDADGTPTGLVNIPVDPSKGYTCPGNPNAISSNLECGDAPDPRTVAAIDLKPHYQDEFIAGLEKQFGESAAWGAKLTYRDLKSAIDDTCTPALGGGCFIFNPGTGNTFWQEQSDGSLKKEHYSARQLGLPKLKRRYYALDLFLEGSIGPNFTGKLNYTFSRNYGNTEGQLHSDLDTGSGGQSDVSATQDWDLPQLMEGASGPLPNHRAHQIKAFGSYQLGTQWRVGGSLIINSGRPRSCTSYYPRADDGLYNGSYYHFCGLPGSGPNPANGEYVPPSSDYAFSPRGSKGTTPWGVNLNLSVAYVPDWARQRLTLQADVMNVLNRQIAQFRDDNYASDRFTMSRYYGQELNYTAPRQVRLSARYDY